jgi:hypothetical protein
MTMRKNKHLPECADCTRNREKWCSYFEAKQTCDYKQYLQQRREPFVDKPGRQDALFTAARGWRAAEVQAAAIRLGFRGGDQSAADRLADKALNDLRIVTDAYSPQRCR